MRTRLVLLSLCLVISATFACAQSSDDGFQMAKVVSLEKMAENAQHMSDEIKYKISMRLEGTLYACQVNAPASTFIDWNPGKQFPVKIEGKTLLAKNPDGRIVQMNIKKVSH